MFLTVSSKRGFGELIKEHIPILRAENIKIKIKNIIVQHTTRIGVFVGTNDEFVNIKNKYENLDKHICEAIKNKLLFLTNY